MKNKNKKVIERNLGNNSTEASTIVKIAIGVIIVFVLIYLIFAVLTGEIKLKKDKKTEPTIQYVEILAVMTTLYYSMSLAEMMQIYLKQLLRY